MLQNNMNITQMEEAENIIYVILSENNGMTKEQLLDTVKELAQQYHNKWNIRA